MSFSPHVRATTMSKPDTNVLADTRWGWRCRYVEDNNEKEEMGRQMIWG